MNKALKILQERGFIQQCTDLQALSDRMDKGQIAFYTGIDPTGSSLHIGHMVPIFALKHLCREGHKGVILVGGGTSRIGDPSGKTEMRKMLSYDELDKNAASIQKQIEKFLAEDIKNVRFVNNKDWLADLNYIDFLRDIGSHFSVNKMLSFEAYKKRMETGLSFLEFNYQILQSFDFLTLNQQYGVELQIGGNDQWGNMVAGSDLIRRKAGREVHVLTFPLIMHSDGQKMGKSNKSALFLDPELVSPYDFFQYFRNTIDADVERFMLLFTFLEISEIEAVCSGDINRAKERLAFEVTALVHGRAEAEKALEGARAAFSGGGNKDAMPTAVIPIARFKEGIGIIDLFTEAGLTSTKSDARRLVEQGGAFVADEKITDVKAVVGSEKLDTDNEIILRAGKKRFMRIIAK